MIHYTTGDLLNSEAEAFVNTVNCEGYMGKGIAYQFKLKYPQNNEDYIKACKTGMLTVGKLHYFKENNKLIVNFPTKDKWREKSKIDYIRDGLDELVVLIRALKIKSIAIPPLGSGNGGLQWGEVKKLIEQKMTSVEDDVDVIIYEPSKNYISTPVSEPKLTLAALVLMQIKMNIDKFGPLRLQKTAFFTNYYYGQDYFHFKKHKYGPYDNSISIVSKNIKAYQKYYNVTDTSEAYRILKSKIISESVETKLDLLTDAIIKASKFVNSIKSNDELECLSTVLFIIEQMNGCDEKQVVSSFLSWSEEKRQKFSENDIIAAVEKLEINGFVKSSLLGYTVSKSLN